METQKNAGQNLPQRRATVTMTMEMLNAPEKTNEIFDLPAVRDNWMRTYEKTTGRTDGALRFEGEKVMLMQLFRSNSNLSKCTRESLYSVWIELAISGLSLRDGLTYVVPYKQKATFQVGWKGRLEQMQQFPTVINVDEPQVVYSCDEFVYEKGMKTVIHKHRPMYPRPEGAMLHFVYMVIHHTYGTVVHMMDRDEVLAVRDKYSQSYKQYLDDLAKSPDGKKVQKNGFNGPYMADIEAPMWVDSEAQAWRKTIVKRVYNNTPKLPHMKAQDERLQEQEFKQDGYVEADDVAHQWTYENALKVENNAEYTEAENVADEKVVVEPETPVQPASQQQPPATSGRAQPVQPVQPATEHFPDANVILGNPEEETF